jgi:hypothetical protein
MARIGDLQVAASARVVLDQDAYVAGSNNGGFAGAPMDNGPGDSTLVLDADYPPLAGGLSAGDTVEVQTEAAGNGHAVVERLTPTQIRVRSFVLGVATDLAYSVNIVKRLVG